MNRALVVRKIQDILAANGRCDNGTEIADSYASAINILNCRLDTCKMFLDQGHLVEALRIAEERPPLFEFCKMFSFDLLPMWQDLCQKKGWPQAETIRSDLVNALKDVFSAPAALEPLMELNRKAMRENDLRMAVRFLRRLVKLDTENTKWPTTLESFEGRYLSELKDQFFPAVALKNTATMHRIAEEIESTNWIAPVDPLLLAGIVDMRKEEKTKPLTREGQESSDNDLFQTIPDEEVITEAPAPLLTLTTTKIDDDHRVAGWTPSSKGLLIACLILGECF
ncbi:MAG: hypothetical protein WCJ02_16120 [bacterium]